MDGRPAPSWPIAGPGPVTTAGERTDPPVTVEVDIGSASSRGRLPERSWMVRVRRGECSVIVTVGLSRVGAEHLADHLIEVLGLDDHPGDTPGGAEAGRAPEEGR